MFLKTNIKYSCDYLSLKKEYKEFHFSSEEEKFFTEAKYVCYIYHVREYEAKRKGYFLYGNVHFKNEHGEEFNFNYFIEGFAKYFTPLREYIQEELEF